VEARHDVVVGQVDLPELGRRLCDGDGRRGAGRAVALQQRAEVDVDELVAVHRDHVALVAAEAGRVTDAAPTPEPLGLASADELHADLAEPVDEDVLLPADAADDHAVDARGGEPADLPREQRPAADRDE
jgi:hypothetical protein